MNLSIEMLAARRVHEDFHRLLMPDGTIAGYAYFHADGRIDYLLHPRHGTTGIAYSLLPMIHAISNDLLTPAQAAAHIACSGTDSIDAARRRR